MKSILIIGGGIAGLSCLEGLFQDYDKNNPQFTNITLISESTLVKRVTNYRTQGRAIEEFDVDFADIDDINSDVPDGLRFHLIVGKVLIIDAGKNEVIYVKPHDLNTNPNHKTISYDILCLATGSSPITWKNLNSDPKLNERVIVIRDATTVENFKKKLEKCRRLVIVGNGGISLELVTRVTNCEKIWIIRDKSIGGPFLDAGAAKFLIDASSSGDTFEPTPDLKRIFYHAKSSDQPGDDNSFGPSLGPNWSKDLKFLGPLQERNHLEIIQEDEPNEILLNSTSSSEYPLRISTKKFKRDIECDLIALAIGVKPNSVTINNGQLKFNPADGGILIDEEMRTSINNIYAAGDIVSCDNWQTNKLWFQMRLWTQARQMGYYMAKCVVAHLSFQNPKIYYNFECFTHCTSFFGFRLVLLGRYNAQGFNKGLGDTNLDMVARVETGKTYIKVLIEPDGTVSGALLLGESGLEETIENLIHDRIDVSAHKEHLLDGTVDIEDYFD